MDGGGDGVARMHPHEARRYSLHIKCTTLSWAAQLDLPEPRRLAQGHHRSHGSRKSVRLYSQDDVYPALLCQEEIIARVRHGGLWRRSSGAQPLRYPSRRLQSPAGRLIFPAANFPMYLVLAGAHSRNPHKTQMGALYEVSGLAIEMGEESLKGFLGTWNVQPVRSWVQSWRRTWLIRAVEKPLVTLLQHDGGLAVIKEAVPRVSTQKPLQRWSQPETKPHVDWPAAWRAPSEPAASSAGTAKATPHGKSQTSAAVNASDLTSVITAALQAALKPFQAKIDALTLDVEALKMQDCYDEEEDTVPMRDDGALGGAVKRKDGEREGPSPARKKAHGA